MSKENQMGCIMYTLNMSKIRKNGVHSMLGSNRLLPYLSNLFDAVSNDIAWL